MDIKPLKKIHSSLFDHEQKNILYVVMYFNIV